MASLQVQIASFKVLRKGFGETESKGVAPLGLPPEALHEPLVVSELCMFTSSLH